MAFWNRGALPLADVAGIAANKLEVRQYVVGPISTNCYAVVSAGEALVIDPGAEGARVAGALEGLRVVGVVATHGHADHVGGVQAVVDACGAPFAMAEPDVELARHAKRNCALGIDYDADAPVPDRLLAEGDHVRVGVASFLVMACPGHTPGGIALVGEGAAEGLVFTGDTLFAGSVGRTDLDGGNHAQLMTTVRRLADELPAQCRVLCGHGPETTMAAERLSNPYLA